MTTYLYESIQSGLFNFTIPGEERTVQLVRGSKVRVKKKLSGSYLNILRLVQTIEDVEATPAPVEEIKIETEVAKPITRMTDRIVKVEEKVEAKAEDTVTRVKEEEIIQAVDDVIKKEVLDSAQANQPVPARRSIRRNQSHNN